MRFDMVALMKASLASRQSSSWRFQTIHKLSVNALTDTYVHTSNPALYNWVSKNLGFKFFLKKKPFKNLKNPV